MNSFPSRLLSNWPLLAVLVGLPVVAAILYGCETRSPVVIPGTDGVRAGERCAVLLASGMDMVRPDSLGLVGVEISLRSAPNEAAESLTQWLRRDDCRGAATGAPLSDQSKTLLLRLLGQDGVERLTADQLTPFDAGSIRDALLASATVGGLADDSEQGLDRVRRLFEYVTRTVSPEGEGSVELPQTAYEAHLFGRGSAEDRAWLFAELLRQVRVDAVILRPSGASDAAAEPWWVAAVLDEDIYLFDADLGVPVPEPDAPPAEAPFVLPRPATWAQVVENPELLTAYRREAGRETASIPAEQLRSLRIELIGPSVHWKPATERLELSLTGNRGVLFYDPLQDTSVGKGLVSRVLEAADGAWPAEAVAIWPYPEHLREARGELTESQRQRLLGRIRPYLGPVEFETGPTQPGSPPSPAAASTRQLWETRVGHMSGRPGAVIRSYVTIRGARTPDPRLSPADQSLNDQAADEAHYWTGQAQYGDGEYEAAVVTAESYIADGGDRSDEAAALVVLALAAQGQIAEAAEAVAALPETTPDLARLRWLATRWKSDAVGRSSSL